MKCSICGAELRVIGRNRETGYPKYKCPKMPHKKCPKCGAELRVIGRNRETGYPKYKCPKMPHKKCPKCGASLITKFAEENFCPKCGYKEMKSPPPFIGQRI